MTPAPETPVHSEAYVAEGGTQPNVPAPPRTPADPPPVPSAWRTYPSVRIAAAILCMAIAALAIWLVFLRSSDSETATPGGGPVGASPEALASLSQRLGQAIYWVGKRSGAQLEATVTTNEYVYVRYLTNGAPVGDASPEFLTVATYPAVDAFGNLRSYANNANAKTTDVAGGGIAVPVPGASTSVYFATPDSDYQVEVYDPDEGAALDLIKSGAIVPVPGGVDPSAPPAS